MYIHPLQVGAVLAALQPAAADLEWAERVLIAWDAFSVGVLQMDGRMVDRPVVLKAQRIRALAARRQ